ncbi:Peroxisome biosynthesis protein pex1 [Ceratobasidium sp. 414]|nr:Peroxisome biosynthesis protein pex1 [Ceratobasidium sp. 414]
MASASSLSKWQQRAQAAAEALDTIEIDPQVAQSYGFKDGATETHAEYVEQNLLSQVRAVAVGQEVSVWAMGRSRVQFRVVSTKPEGQVVLLGPDTEVAIAPKLRAPPNPRTQKTSEDKPPAEIQSESTPSAGIDDPFPLALRVFPTRLASAFVSVGSSETEVHISTRDAQQISSQDPNSPCTHAWLVRVRPPRSIREFDKRGKPVEKATPTPVVLQQNKKEKKPDEGRADVPGVLVRVKAHEGVPVGHAVMVGLESRIQEWDTILLTRSDQPPEATSRSSSPSQTALAEVHTQKPAADAEGSELAGVDSILADCHDFFVRTYMQPGAFGTAGGQHCGFISHTEAQRWLIITNSTWVTPARRTRIRKDVRREVGCVVYVDLAQMADEHTPALRSKFKTWKAVAAWRQPCVLVLDNLDKVVSAEVEVRISALTTYNRTDIEPLASKKHTDSARARHLAEHFLDVFAASPARDVAILASCASPSALHPLLASSHVFACKVQLRAPDKAARRDILSRIVKRRFATSDLRSDTEKPLNFVALATDTEGYSATDLQDLVGRAVHAAAMRSAADDLGGSRVESRGKMKPVLLPVDFAKAHEDFVPLSLRGLEETRRVLRETLEWPTKYGAIFAKCPLRLRSGLLLYGYPGCGKTLLASAVAKECGLNFISVKGPELLNKYIGQSEQSYIDGLILLPKVRDIFDRASAAKPCVLFLDEFDSIAPKRGHDSTGVTDRVVNQMLTQMDGAEGLDGVYVLAATSRPDLIDPALLRPGRLDKSLLCHMPAEGERHDILKAVTRKVSLAPDVELVEIAKRTEGYSGADLQALVYNAQLEVVHEELAVAGQSLATSGSSSRVETQIKLEIVGGPKDSTTMTRAETAVLEKRVATMLAARTPKQPRTTGTRHGTRSEKPRVGHESTDLPETSLTKKNQSQITLTHLERSLENHRPSVSPEERWRLQTM